MSRAEIVVVFVAACVIVYVLDRTPLAVPLIFAGYATGHAFGQWISNRPTRMKQEATQ